MKKGIIVLAFLLSFSLTLTSCGIEYTSDTISRTATNYIDEQMVSVKCSSEDFVGMNYIDAEDELKKFGFSCVKINVIADLNADEHERVGIVTEVSINGSSSFKASDEFDSLSNIVISYHDLKEFEIPYSIEELSNFDADTIKNKLSETGFKYVSVNEVFDLDPDGAVVLNNEMTINGSSAFTKGNLYKCDSQIELTSHKPYQKYDVDFSLNFIGNWFFDKYNVDVEVDDEEYCTLNHGESSKWKFRFREGKHKITFLSSKDHSIKNSVYVEVDSDVDMSYKLSCGSESITLEEEYTDHKRELDSNQAKIKCTNDSFLEKDYKDVIESLKQSGFTNIEEAPLYDIYWGVTTEGSVENVTINGKLDYKYGDVFDKSSKVVVSYHLKEEKNPEWIKVTSDKTEYLNMDPENVKNIFMKMGFSNIEIKEDKYAKETVKYGMVSDVKINYSSFKSDEAFKPESKVIIYVSAVASVTTSKQSSDSADKLIPDAGNEDKIVTESTPKQTTKPTSKQSSATTNPKPATTSKPVTTPKPATTPKPTPEPTPEPERYIEPEVKVVMVWIPTNGGTKYHSKSSCSKMKDPENVTKDEAIARGFEPCGRCY